MGIRLRISTPSTPAGARASCAFRPDPPSDRLWPLPEKAKARAFVDRKHPGPSGSRHSREAPRPPLCRDPSRLSSLSAAGVAKTLNPEHLVCRRASNQGRPRSYRLDVTSPCRRTCPTGTGMSLLSPQSSGGGAVELPPHDQEKTTRWGRCGRASRDANHRGWSGSGPGGGLMWLGPGTPELHRRPAPYRDASSCPRFSRLRTAAMRLPV